MKQHTSAQHILTIVVQIVKESLVENKRCFLEEHAEDLKKKQGKRPEKFECKVAGTSMCNLYFPNL
jgi:hypothetical protein